MHNSDKHNHSSINSGRRIIGLFLFLSVVLTLVLSACTDQVVIGTPAVPTASTQVKPEKALELPTAIKPTNTAVPVPTLNPQQIVAATQTANVESAGVQPNSTGYFFAGATSHSVEAFADAFATFGGVESLGYPITQAFLEQSTSDGRFYWVQLFEKAELEYHSSDMTNPYQITPLGVWRFSQKYSGDTPPPKIVPGKGSNTFAETGHIVQGLFLDYWNNHGGLSRFGFPVSEAFDEQSDVNGKTYLVQYFERAEMEYHPEQKTANRVQLAALGSMKVAQIYANGVPSGAGDPIPSPTVNATATVVAIANATSTAEAAKENANATAETAKANKTATVISHQQNATATAEAANALSPADLAYLNQAEEWSTNYSTALNSLSGLMSEAGDDTSLLFDDDWKTQVVEALVVMSLTSDEILQYGTPPSKFKAIHADFKVIANEANSAVDNIAEGVDNFDTDAIEKGTANMKKMTTYAKRILNEMQAFIP